MRISLTSKLYLFFGAVMCCVIIIGAWLEGQQIPAFFGLISADTRLFVTRTLFYVGGQPVRVLFLIKTFLFLAFLNLVSRIGRQSVRLLARHTSRFDQHREYVISRVVSFAVYAIGILIGVNVENVNLSTLVILGGTLGVAVGFGLQSLVSNLVSGIILLIEQPIRLGDNIEVGGRAGEVLRVGSRSSWIRTYDNAILVIPNLELVTKEILNWTATETKSRISIAVSVAYGSSSENVMQVLLEIAHCHPDVLGVPAPAVTISSLEPSSIIFTLSVWTLLKVNNFGRLRSDVYLKVLSRFKENAISLPFPQLDLHLSEVPPRFAKS